MGMISLGRNSRDLGRIHEFCGTVIVGVHRRPSGGETRTAGAPCPQASTMDLAQQDPREMSAMLTACSAGSIRRKRAIALSGIAARSVNAPSEAVR